MRRNCTKQTRGVEIKSPLVVFVSPCPSATAQLQAGVSLSSPAAALTVTVQVRSVAAGLHAELIRTGRAAGGAPGVRAGGLAHRPPVDISAGN